jgi:hypothetical protein
MGINTTEARRPRRRNAGEKTTKDAKHTKRMTAEEQNEKDLHPILLVFPLRLSWFTSSSLLRGLRDSVVILPSFGELAL